MSDLDSLWDFADPLSSEGRFLARLAASEAESPEARAEILTQAARAQGLQRRFADAHQTLDKAEPLAGVGRARVRLLLERGRVHNSSGSPAVARPFFEESWTLAGSLKEDGLAVDAAHMIAIVAGGEGSLRWNERALELARTSSNPDARRWLGSLYNNVGWTYHGMGRLEEALAMFRAALAERERTGKPGPLMIARWTVARALRSLGRCDEALREQMALLQEHARSGTSDGFVEEEVAENLVALGRGEEALPHFARAFELLSADPWFVEKESARLRRLGEFAGRTSTGTAGGGTS